MIRYATLLLLAGGLVLATAPGFAQATDGVHHTRKVPKPRKAAPKAPAMGSGINAPSTDFSKIERADEEPSGPDAPTFRPTMSSGGMGLGGAF